MTYECPCGCHIEIADLRRQLAEAQQARERAQVAAIEIAKDRAEIKATLGESHALLRRAQELIIACDECWRGKADAELAAAITAHLEPEKTKP